jgi:hypothetical protein
MLERLPKSLDSPDEDLRGVRGAALIDLVCIVAAPAGFMTRGSASTIFYCDQPHQAHTPASVPLFLPWRLHSIQAFDG